jgi:type IV pilus assembly protein PilB
MNTQYLHPLDSLQLITRQDFVKNPENFPFSGHSIPSIETASRILQSIDNADIENALVIGAGSGYVPALLSSFCKQVIALEKNVSLARISESRFKKLGIKNIRLVSKALEQVDKLEAPFSLIMVCTPKVIDKAPLLQLLGKNGELLAIEKEENNSEYLYKYNSLGKKQKITRLDFSNQNSNISIGVDLINPELLEKAKANTKKNNSLLAEELRKLANVDEQTLYRSMAATNDIEFGNIDNLLRKSNPRYFKACSRAFLDANHILPIFAEGRVLKVATSDPDASLKELQIVFPDHELQKVLVSNTDFHRLWSTLELGVSGLSAQQSIKTFDDSDLLERNLGSIDAHLIYLFESLLLDAVAERASDIHIEKYGHRVRIRLRIDGDLQDLPYYHINDKELKGLINVIKLRAELDISEKRLPQGGRSRLKVGKDLYDLRVQTQPSLHSEHVIIRLLPQNSSLISIDKLGLSEQLTHTYKRLLNNPSGMVLVVGPTGSGKSTTLYAGLQVLSKEQRRKVITIEDPVEYSIENIQQSQIKPEIGFHFHDAMRSFVRQDPDVIFVGEIRDTETALEAVRASQTGHLLLSTLHSNDSIDSLQRLYDLDLKPNSIASELLAVIAQRLAKKVCEHCKVEASPNTELVNEVFPSGLPDDFKCYEGKGCLKCNGQGTHGRIAIVEFMPVSLELRDAISNRVSTVELRNLAMKNGLISMRDSALEHVTQGLIPLSELPRLILQERLKPE